MFNQSEDSINAFLVLEILDTLEADPKAPGLPITFPSNMQEDPSERPP